MIAERIVDEDDISFQDMQIIRREFSKNLKIDLSRGRIDEKFAKQVSGVRFRTR